MPTLYGYTNKFSRDVNNCVIFASDVDQHKKPLLTYSVFYYFNELYKRVNSPSLHDFKGNYEQNETGIFFYFQQYGVVSNLGYCIRCYLGY